MRYCFNIIVLSLLFAFAACTKSNAQSTSIHQLRQIDIGHSIICHDTIFIEPEVWIDSTSTYSNEDSLCLKKIGHIEPLGYRGPNFQRFYIHFSTVVHQGNGDYRVEGYTRYRDTIRYFSGHIMLDSITQYKEWQYLELAKEEGTIFAHYVLDEDTNSAGAGILSGKASFDYAKRHGRFYYDALGAVADGYCNNQYQGTWTSYDLKQHEKCNWGDFRIPDSQGLDTGCGMFLPHEKYVDFGWKLYHELSESHWGTAEYDSLLELKEADEMWWTQIKD